jgi:hypothetical protein
MVSQLLQQSSVTTYNCDSDPVLALFVGHDSIHVPAITKIIGPSLSADVFPEQFQHF